MQKSKVAIQGSSMKQLHPVTNPSLASHMSRGLNFKLNNDESSYLIKDGEQCKECTILFI